MDCRDDSLHPPELTISDVDPHGIPLMQDGFYGSYETGIPQVQDLDFNVPWQVNFWNYGSQAIQQVLNDVASEYGIANNDAWEEGEGSLMYEAGRYSVPLDVAMEEEIENFLNHPEHQFLWVPQDGANEGLQEDAILKNLKTRRYAKPEMCVVCQLEYEDNETLGTLACGHEFHAECIKTWLLQKNVCPLCKQTAIVL